MARKPCSELEIRLVDPALAVKPEVHLPVAVLCDRVMVSDVEVAKLRPKVEGQLVTSVSGARHAYSVTRIADRYTPAGMCMCPMSRCGLR